MTVTRIEFGESAQPGDVTLITVEDRVASQDAATRAEGAAARAEAAEGTFTAPANDVVATMVTDAGPTKTAVDDAIANAPDVVAAHSMAARGFAPKTQPLAAMWAFPGVSGHGFTSVGTAGATFNMDDTTDFCLGDRSVKMTPPTYDPSYARIAKTGVVINATAQYVRTWVKIDDITKLNTSLMLLLGDNTFANYWQAVLIDVGGVTNPERKAVIKSGQWTAIDVPWSSFTAGGGTPPARSAISAAALLVYGKSTGSATVRWNGVGGVNESTAYPNGVISLTFDDTYEAAYTVARPYMDKYGYPGTLYPIQGIFGTAGRLTEQMAMDLYRINGWDFGYHATTQAAHDAGFDTYTEAQLVSEFEGQRIWASQRGITGDSFAWPLAYFNSLSETVAARYFRTGRTNGASGTETLPPFAPMRIRPILANAGASLSSLQGLADRVKSGKCWGVVTFHNIVASGATANDTTTATFQGFVDYLKAQGIAVATVGQVMNRL